MSETTPNLFILLDLDPDASWTTAAYENAKKKKREIWVRMLPNPKTAIEAKRNLESLKILDETAADSIKRAAQVDEARNIKKSAKAADVVKLGEDLDLLQVKGYLLQTEVDGLVKKYSPSLTEAAILEKIKVKIQPASTDKKEKKPTLDSTLAATIKSQLDGLGKKDLYEFLGMGRKVENKLLFEKADELYKKAQANANKTAEVTLTSQLAGHCRSIFDVKTPDKRDKYDATLELQKLEGLRPKIDLIASATKKIVPAQVDKLLEEARELGVDADIALEFLREYCGKKGFFLQEPSGAAEKVDKLQQCGNCDTLSPSDQKFCTGCGRALKEACPKCGKEVATSAMACGKCGFPAGNRSYIEGYVLVELDAALKSKKLIEIRSWLDQAKREWPGKDDHLSKEIQKREIEYDRLNKELEDTRKASEDLLKQLEEADKNKRFYTVLELLKRGIRNSLNESQFNKYEQAARKKIAEAETKLEEAKREKNNPAKYIDILMEVLSICADCQAARDLIAKCPPEKPAEVTCSVIGNVVRVQWTASRSRSTISYHVIRKSGARPADIKDGQLLRQVKVEELDDNTPEIGIVYYYAVFADREGIISLPAYANQPVLIKAEVQDLAVRPSSGALVLTWTPPKNVTQVHAVRSESIERISIHEGHRIQVNGKKQATDSGLVNNRTYYYRVYCEFTDAAKKAVYTDGITISAVPKEPPSTAIELRVSPVAGAKNQVKIEWSPLKQGALSIFRSPELKDFEIGEVVADSQLKENGPNRRLTAKDGRPQVIDTLENNENLVYYLPLLHIDGHDYAGSTAIYSNFSDVSDLSAQHNDQSIRLKWAWPMGCEKVIVKYSEINYPSYQDTKASSKEINQERYQTGGGHLDIPGGFNECYVVVYALYRVGNKWQNAGGGPSAQIFIKKVDPLTISYKVIQKGLLQKSKLFELTIEGEGQMPAMVLRGKPAPQRPCDKNDGEKIMSIAAGQAQPKMEIPIPMQYQNRNLLVGLFLVDDALYSGITINKPAGKDLQI